MTDLARWVVVAFGVLVGVTIMLGVLFGFNIASTSVAAVAAAGAVIVSFAQLSLPAAERSPRQLHPQPPRTPGRGRHRRALPWLVLGAGTVLVVVLGGVLALFRSGHDAGAPAGRVAPKQVSAPDFAGFCRATGQGSAYLTTNLAAYGWKCSTPNASIGLDAQDVCVWTNHTRRIINRLADFNDPDSWQCWTANGELGPLNWDTYCLAKGLGHARDTGRNNAYTWYCAGSPVSLDSQDACQVLYASTPPISRFQNFYDKNSWQCWG